MSNDRKIVNSSQNNEKSYEEIYSGFQSLRNEQRLMVNKLCEMEAELNEHKIVIDTLKNIDQQRKCYRMIGGVLCERTVEEVMPSLVINKEQLLKVIKNLNEQLSKRGSEINEYKERYNIRIKGQDDIGKEEELKESKRNAVVINPL